MSEQGVRLPAEAKPNAKGVNTVCAHCGFELEPERAERVGHGWYCMRCLRWQDEVRCPSCGDNHALANQLERAGLWKPFWERP